MKRDRKGRPKGFGEPTLTHGILRFSHFLDLWEQCALLPCGERAFLLFLSKWKGQVRVEMQNAECKIVELRSVDYGKQGFREG